MPTIEITFDKPVYAPGDTITATATVDGLEGSARVETGSGRFVLADGTALDFEGQVTITDPPPTVTGGQIDGPDYLWNLDRLSDTTAAFKADV